MIADIYLRHRRNNERTAFLKRQRHLGGITKDEARDAWIAHRDERRSADRVIRDAQVTNLAEEVIPMGMATTFSIKKCPDSNVQTLKRTLRKLPLPQLKNLLQRFKGRTPLHRMLLAHQARRRHPVHRERQRPLPQSSRLPSLGSWVRRRVLRAEASAVEYSAVLVTACVPHGIEGAGSCYVKTALRDRKSRLQK